MNWINSLQAWQWGLLLAVPPLVVMLYFLKLRRLPLDVPSTFLWQRTIEDLHVNSLWQKLRQSLLLYLQLAFLLGVILACLRPGIPGSERSGNRYIFMIDNSASMRTTDVAPNRLEDAKRQAKAEIQALESGDVAMLIAFSDRADVRQGFTLDKQRLLSALNGIEPTNRTTSLGEALRAAAGLANPGRASFDNINDIQVAEALPAKLRIFSDGGFEQVSEFDLGNLTPIYTPIGTSDAANAGIVSFSVQRNEENEEQVEAFARIFNNADRDIRVMATLSLDGQELDATEVDVAAGEEAGVNFQLNQVPEGVMELKIDYPDAFVLDNTAFAALRPARQLSVLLVTEGNNALEIALRTPQLRKVTALEQKSVDYLQSEDYQQKSSTGYFDLVVFDRCSPSELPACNTFFIGAAPMNTEWKLSEPQGPLMIVDWDRGHPAMEYLEMGSVRIVEGQMVTPPDAGAELMRSDLGTIMAISPRGAYQDAVLGFPMIRATSEGTQINTDWAIKRSFPVFIYSIVEFLGGGITTASAASVLPGQPIGLTLSNRFDRFDVEAPQGKKIEIQRGVQSQLNFTQTEQTGIYRVKAPGVESPLEIFSVNLFSPRESRIQTIPEVQLGGERVEVGKETIVGRTEYWRWLLLACLVVLVLEWVVYNRRVFV